MTKQRSYYGLRKVSVVDRSDGDGEGLPSPTDVPDAGPPLFAAKAAVPAGFRILLDPDSAFTQTHGLTEMRRTRPPISQRSSSTRMTSSRLPTGDANVNGFWLDAILARHPSNSAGLRKFESSDRTPTNLPDMRC